MGVSKDKQPVDRFAAGACPEFVLLFDDRLRAWRQLADVSRHPEPAKRFAELCEEYRLSSLRLVRVLGEKSAAGVSVPTGRGTDAKPG